MYEKLVMMLRKHYDEHCPLDRASGICGGVLANEAADAIEELANKLCDWCGVCPKEKRRPWECEIMWPNGPIPEVYIEPPKEET